MTRWRVLWLWAGAAAALALSVLGAAVWLLATEAGTGWVVARLQAHAAIPVSFAELRGTFWHGLIVNDVRMEIASDRLRVARASLGLDLGDLLGGRLTLTRLALTEARYERGEAAPQPRPRTAFALPLGILVRDGSIERLTVVMADRELAFGPVALSVAGAGERITMTDITADGLGFRVRGNGELALGTDLGMTAELSWETVRDGVRFVGNGRIEGTWPNLELHQELSVPFSVIVEGNLRLGASPSAALRARWSDLALPQLVSARSPSGSLEVTGWVRAYDFETSGAMIVEEIESDFSASGSGTMEALEFASLRLAGAYGEVTANGHLGLDPLTWQLEVDGRNLNPAVRLPDWPGALAVSGRLSGRAAPALEVALAGVEASGELRQRPVTATGGIAYRAPDRWEFDALSVEVSGNRFAIDGRIGAMLALDVSVDATALDLALPDAAGSLQIDGRLAGTPDRPELSGSAQASDLRYGDYAVESLSLSGDIVADDVRPVTLDVAATNVSWSDVSVSRLTGSVSGTATDHVAEIDAVSEHGAARLRAAGGWSGRAWDGTLTELMIEESTLGAWRLVAPAAVAFGRTSLDLGRACLRRDSAELCGASRLGTDDDRVDLELTAFDLAVLDAVLPEDLALAGVYDARLSLAGTLRQPSGTFSARGRDTLITIREVDSPPLDVPIEALELQADLSELGELRIEGGLQGPSGARVSLSADVTELWADEPGVMAEVSGYWSDLRILSLLSPDVGEVSGEANVDLMLTGSLRDPDIRGRAHWSDGRLDVPRWGFVVEAIEADLSSPDGARLLLEASGTAGEGRINVSGVTDVDPEAGWPTELRVYGDSLQAVRLPEADIVVSPALHVRAALPEIDVDGAFLIPHARLSLDELPPQAARPSPDTVVHGVERPERRRPLNVHADIRVGVGEDVRYSGAGLDVALSGAMGLIYRSGESAVASGTLNLTGNYQAYGQTLDIEQGELLFTGPLGNPNLDVRAIRRITSTAAGAVDRPTIVGIALSGTVNAPVATVFSEPAMNEADALAYLLFGRPVSASGDEETATLESAAFAMGLQQALPVIQRVGETLGLDEFSLQPTTADAGEIMAGKRLSERVYVRYSYGLFNRIGGLLMRFSLNRRLSLETRSGDYRSMDLIYTVEKD